MGLPFDVLADDNRRRILDALRVSERLVGHLADEIGISQPAVSRHLKLLREAGLVDVRPDAQRRWYRLRPEPLAAVDAWLEPYRRLWSQRLDALEAHLDAEAQADSPEPARATRLSAKPPRRSAR